MKKSLKGTLVVLLTIASYFASYSIWRGPAMMEKCDHPYSVDLPNGTVAKFYAPAIAVDRYIHQFTTEINIVN